MYQIICPQCSNPNNFETEQSRPEECCFCFTVFNKDVAVHEIPDQTKGKLTGLKLVYQQTSGIIEINGESNLLGREHIGSQILSKILVNQKQVISRKHCSINLHDGKYYLKDEGSTNGTFYGVSKIDCLKEAQLIENNSILFLGREAFLVQCVYEEVKESQAEIQAEKEEQTSKPVLYRCKEGCGFESETYLEICPKCMSINSLIAISG